jgi:aminoglycoside 3-N-acetyltransferase
LSEKKIIDMTPFPNTRSSLIQNLHALGIRKGMVLLVHASLGAMGWVCGGPVTVVQSLMHAVSDRGTVVMPTHSHDYSNPEKWKNPPVPDEWIRPIKENMPPFQPAYTPSSLGKVAECFRQFPGVLRSVHPLLSFAAWGALKKKIISNHSLDYGLGDESPLARIYERDGYVLLLGVPYANNTSFHLAEYRSHIRTHLYEEAPIREGGRRVWKSYRDIDYSNSEFETIGAAFEKEGHVTRGFVGLAESRLFSQKQAVDFAQKWYEMKCQ